MRSRFLVAALAVLVMALAITVAFASTRKHDRLPLHVGSSGPKVCELKYLLRNPRPKQNVFTKVKGIYSGQQCAAHPSAGYFGKSFAKDVYAYKYRLGYPARFNRKSHPIASSYFFNLLRGKKHPTLEMVALAQKRLHSAIEPGVTPRAMTIRTLALSQVGIHEIPWGSNRGPHISYPVSSRYGSYQGVTGAYGAAWCASFDQWVFRYSGYGTFANASAGVYYIVDWARYHGFLNAKAKVGSLVAFLGDGGHIGIVIKIVGGSGYMTVEGNSGDAVREVYHPWNDRLRVFVNLPGVA